MSEGDLLKSLRETRQRLAKDGNRSDALIMRLADVAIGLGEAAEKMLENTVALVCGDRDECPLCQAHLIAEEALTAAKKTWEEGR